MRKQPPQMARVAGLAMRPMTSRSSGVERPTTTTPSVNRPDKIGVVKLEKRTATATMTVCCTNSKQDRAHHRRDVVDGAGGQPLQRQHQEEHGAHDRDQHRQRQHDAMYLPRMNSQRWIGFGISANTVFLSISL